MQKCDPLRFMVIMMDYAWAKSVQSSIGILRNHIDRPPLNNIQYTPIDSKKKNSILRET